MIRRDLEGGVIDSPSVRGPGCNYIDLAIDLDPTFVGTTAGTGLPGFVQSSFIAETGCIQTGINNDSYRSAALLPVAFPLDTTGTQAARVAIGGI